MNICIPLFKACGRHIEYIDKAHCNLLAVPDDVIRSARTLEELNLEANQISEFPKHFFRLTKLRWLCMSYNSLTEIPAGVGSFTLLSHLDLSYNEITRIAPHISACTNLTFLDLSNNNSLRLLPSGFSQLRCLRYLNLTNCYLAQLPVDFGNLQKLERLELRETDLAELPLSFDQLQQLQTLDLGKNGMWIFPKSLTALNNLQELFIDGNEIEDLPQEINRLNRLQTLDASENKLRSLPKSLSGLTSLTDLNLSENLLDVLPDSIGDMKNLQHLKAGSNGIAHVSPRIGSCTYLRELILSDNVLTKLPDEIGLLTNLTFLAAFQNRLEELPKTIGKCWRLEIFLLRENILRSIPEEIGALAQLHVLDIAANRLRNLPTSLLQCKNLSSLWLSTNQSNSAVRLQSSLDPKTRKQVLTCYLLPQESIDSESAENIPSKFTDRASTYLNPRASTHSLANSVTEEDRNRFSYVDDEGRKVRIHPKFDKKAIEGHVILKDSSTNKETSFAPARVTSQLPVDSNFEDNVAEVKAAILRKVSAPLHSRASAGFMGSDANRSSLRAGRDQKPILPHQSATLEAGRHAEMKPNLEISKRATIDASNARSRPSDTLPGPSKELQSSKMQQSAARSRDSSSADTSTSGSNESLSSISTPVNSPLPVHNGVLSEEHKMKGVSHGIPSEKLPLLNSVKSPETLDNKEEDGSNKRVDFSEDVEDNEDDDKSDLKLMRRDTPHYTKRARISKNPTDENASSEMVMKIMEKYRPTSTASTKDGIGGPEQVPPNASDETLTVHVKRTPRTGLGISIAGGIGSQPYRGGDYGIFISKCVEDKPAYQCGLRVGDKLLEVNGVNLLDAEHLTAVNALRNVGDEFDCVVCRPSSSSSTSKLPHVAATDTTSSLSTFNAKPAPVTNALTPRSNEMENGGFLSGQEELVCIKKGSGQLGLTVVGGIDHWSHPFGLDEPGVFISKITPGGAASIPGRLRMGDRILQINGEDLTRATHEEAVKAIIMARGPEMKLLIRHEKPPDGMRTLSSLLKAALMSGLYLAGGSHDGEPSSNGSTSPSTDPHDEGIFITRLPMTMSQEKTGLKVGQRLLAVDDYSMLGASINDCIKAFSQSGPKINLVVCDGVPHVAVTRFLQKGCPDFPIDPSKNNPSTDPSNGSLGSHQNNLAGVVPSHVDINRDALSFRSKVHLFNQPTSS